MNSKFTLTGKVLLSALCLAILGSCSNDDPTDNNEINEQKILSFSFTTRATSDAAPTTTTEVAPSSVTLFGARSANLFARTNLTTTSGSASASAMDGDVFYFVSGLEDGDISVTDSTVSTLLNATLSSTSESPAKDFLVGTSSVGTSVKSGSTVNVELHHSTARIDIKLNGDASNIIINKLTLEGVSSSTYVFPSDFVSGVNRTALTGTTNYEVNFDGGFTNGSNTTVTKQGVSYVYESQAGVRAVLEGTQDGTPVKYAVTLPQLNRGSVYEISITNDKANVNIGFTVKDWANGGSYNATITND